MEPTSDHADEQAANNEALGDLTAAVGQESGNAMAELTASMGDWPGHNRQARRGAGEMPQRERVALLAGMIVSAINILVCAVAMVLTVVPAIDKGRFSWASLYLVLGVTSAILNYAMFIVFRTVLRKFGYPAPA